VSGGLVGKEAWCIHMPSRRLWLPTQSHSKKGIKWAASMTASSCPPWDAWLSLHYQLFPKISYGLAAVSIPPTKLETVFQSIYFKSLLALKVNRNITKLFCTLPYKFQGIDLPNANIEVLALNFHLLQNYWRMKSSIAKLLK